MLRGISASSTSCRFHCPTNCTNCGSLVLGAQIVHSNEDDGKLALSLKKKQQIFTFPPFFFAHFWAFIHLTSSTHRSFTDLPLIDPTSIPHLPNPRRPYILLSFKDNLFVMIPTLNSETVYHHHISIVFPHHHHISIVFPLRHYHHISIVFPPGPPLHFNYFPFPPAPPPPHFYCFPSSPPPPHFYYFPPPTPHLYCFSSTTTTTTFLLFLLLHHHHHHHISIIFLLHHHISIIFLHHHHISLFSPKTTTTFQLFSLTTTTASLLFSLNHHHQRHISINSQHHYKAIK